MPLDRESVLRYARLCEERVRGTPDQIVEAELRAWFAQHRFLDKPHFLKLGRWKSPRPIRWYEQNDAQTIEAITRAAIASTDERRKMDLLRQLRGVDYRVASTILHFAHPDRYMILDVRAKWSLGWDDRPDSPQLWLDYTDRVRALARSLDVPLRTLDMALWEFSKRHQPPARDRESLQKEIVRLRAELEALTRGPGPATLGHAVVPVPPNRELSPQPHSDLEQRFDHLMKDLYLKPADGPSNGQALLGQSVQPVAGTLRWTRNRTPSPGPPRS
jgi:hypothetical protein